MGIYREKVKLLSHLTSVDKYDEIYLGFPNYWGTMPMAVFTFLEQFDWSGKKIYPFVTHEGSGFGRSENDLKKTCRGASIQKGFSVQGSMKDFIVLKECVEWQNDIIELIKKFRER